MNGVAPLVTASAPVLLAVGRDRLGVARRRARLERRVEKAEIPEGTQDERRVERTYDEPRIKRDEIPWPCPGMVRVRCYFSPMNG